MFKVGDWIIEPNGKITRLEFNVEPGSYYAEECKLWQPKVGEWCWQSFTFEENGLYHEFSLHRFSSISNKALNYEPFIGELPSFIEE